VLSIACINADSVGHTYVSQPIRRIAPGRTIVLALNGTTVRIQYVNCLNVDRESGGRTLSKLISGVNMLCAGFSGAVAWRREREVLNFLQSHNVRVILVEFGQSGSALRRFRRRHRIDLFVKLHGFDASVMPKQFTTERPIGCAPAIGPASSAVCGISGPLSWTSVTGTDHAQRGISVRRGLCSGWTCCP
jgi:hypothetical protein